MTTPPPAAPSLVLLRSLTTPAALLLAAALLAGCAATGNTVLPRPQVNGRIEPNRVEVPNSSDEAWLDLPGGTLTSDASLAEWSSESVCFDVVVRQWTGAGQRFEARVVDGDERVIATRSWDAPRCTYYGLDGDAHRTGEVPAAPGGAGDPAAESTLEDGAAVCLRLARPTDPHQTIDIVGDRLCFPSRGLGPEHSDSVRLELVQGQYTMRFGWEFAPQPILADR